MVWQNRVWISEWQDPNTFGIVQIGGNKCCILAEIFRWCRGPVSFIVTSKDYWSNFHADVGTTRLALTMKSKIYNGIAIAAGSALLCQFASSYLLSFTSLRSYFLDPDYVSTAFADVLVTILLYTAAVLFWHLSSQHLGNVRRFWRLMSMGCAIWGITWAIWVWLEVINRIEVPTPSIADIVLFIHLVPFMGALLEQPHHHRELPKSNSLLDFLLLLCGIQFHLKVERLLGCIKVNITLIIDDLPDICRIYKFSHDKFGEYFMQET